MTAYLPGSSRTIYKVRLEVAPGVWVARSTGTRDPRQAARLHAMCRTLGGRGLRAWDVLAKVQRNEWSLPALWDRWEASGQSVARLRTQLDEVTLAPLVEPFVASVAKRRSQDTADHYRVYLTRLLESEFRVATDLTVGRLEAWLDRLPFSAGTVRKHAAGVSAWCAWLVRRGVLVANPMREVPKPEASTARESYLETADAIRLADAQPEPYRTLAALLAGTGLDLSLALSLTRRQVDPADWSLAVVRPKTKTPHRVVIAAWARPYVQRAVSGLLPEARLFEGVTRFQAGKVHRSACAAIGLQGYWLRDHRHTWAVRHFKAGGSAQEAAQQLGHKDGGVLALTVYGRHLPTRAEQERTAQAR